MVIFAEARLGVHMACKLSAYLEGQKGGGFRPQKGYVYEEKCTKSYQEECMGASIRKLA